MREIIITSLLIAVAINHATAALLTHGDQCLSDAMCDSAKGLECEVSYKQCGTIGLCTCKTAKPIWISGSLTCETSKIKGAACTDDGECKGVMTCTSSVCVCGATTDDISCKSVTEFVFGEACTASDDATCWNAMTCPASPNKCACPANQFDDGNGYCRKHYHGESCTVVADCVGDNIACTSSLCACDNSAKNVLHNKILGCTASGSTEEIHSCASDDITGHDSCKDTNMCKKCGAGPLQCLTFGEASSSGVGEKTWTTGLLLSLAGVISRMY